jgi:hypothetical protein
MGLGGLPVIPTIKVSICVKNLLIFLIFRFLCFYDVKADQIVMGKIGNVPYLLG